MSTARPWTTARPICPGRGSSSALRRSSRARRPADLGLRSASRSILAPVSATGLFPRGAPRPTSSAGEQALHRALETGLPQGWTAWHSLRVRSESGWEGEGDFVVAIPDRGLLVIEVKSGAIEVRDGQWLQNGKQMDRAPREQGHSFARLLVRKLEERGLAHAPPFEVATAFPSCPFSNPPRQGDLEGAVLGQQDLPYLRRGPRGDARAAVRHAPAASGSAFRPCAPRALGRELDPSPRARATTHGSARKSSCRSMSSNCTCSTCFARTSAAS